MLLRRTFEIPSCYPEGARNIFETFNLYNYANLDQCSSTHSLRKLCLMRNLWPKKVQSFSLSHARIESLICSIPKSVPFPLYPTIGNKRVTVIYYPVELKFGSF